MVGDYILQTHAMATQKTSSWKYAILHGVTYGIPFIVATHSVAALLVIVVTHIIIDRFRLARHLMWLKNQFAPKQFRPDRSALKTTGYPAETPAWLSTWLMIIADNCVHVCINTAAIIFLGQIWVVS